MINRPFVEYQGEVIYAFEEKPIPNFTTGGWTLDLEGKRIPNIHDIIGLEKLDFLKELNLSFNHITEIKGLENLADLRMLDLSLNKLTKISGLDDLRKL
jgi:Leucine-rich repeat (LRR) protein